MKRILLVAVLFAACATAIAVPPIVWWKLDRIVDARTVVLRSEDGETRTFTLAGIGIPVNETAATNFIQMTIGDRKVLYWPLQTAETNWHARPMCIFYGFEKELRDRNPAVIPPERQRINDSGVVYDQPMLNEEMILQGITPLTNEVTTGDEYLLYRRLKLADEMRKKGKPNQGIQLPK